ncbi:MAG TPA: response regulator [Polyangiales bacterium]|nr:response regulator [Polyangiales bacterium]
MGAGDCRGRFARALIVDDNEALRRSLARLIGSWGAQVSSAATLKGAAELLDPAPDLIVCDVRLPDGNGCALFECALRMVPRPLLIVISGRASGREGFDLARIGVHGYLEKPFELAELEGVLREALVYRDGVRDHKARVADPNRLELELAEVAEQKSLSIQQVELLRHLLRGASRKQLPLVLGVSENTCKTAIRRLLARYGVARLSDVVREIVARSSAGSGERTQVTQRR